MPFATAVRNAAWVALLVSLSACNREQPYEKPLTPVNVAVVETYVDASNTVKYSGTIEPHSRVDLSFRVSGYVQQLDQVRDPGGGERPLQDGDAVAAGTVLARLRDADYIEKVNQARSALDQAQAGLAQARFSVKAAEVARDKAHLDLQRANNLFAKQSLTKVDLDAARAASDAADATVEGVQAQVAQAQARIEGARSQVADGELALRDVALIAPSSGVVLKRLVEVGSLVGPGAPAFSLIEVGTVKMIFGAPDVLVNRLRLGQTLPITTEAVRGARFTGRITGISPAADTRSRVFEIEISVPNSGGQLRPGMIASLDLQEGSARQGVPVVPLPAVVKAGKDANTYSVFVVERNDGRDLVHARSVRLGDAVGNRVAVTEGVRAGESVVVSGATLVRDGEPVQVIP